VGVVLGPTRPARRKGKKKKRREGKREGEKGKGERDEHQAKPVEIKAVASVGVPFGRKKKKKKKKKGGKRKEEWGPRIRVEAVNNRRTSVLRLIIM